MVLAGGEDVESGLLGLARDGDGGPDALRLGGGGPGRGVGRDVTDREDAELHPSKHVASRTLTEVKWNATLLGDDVVDAVRKLKEQPGGDILKVGTGGSFSRTLLEHGLVDEYLFWLFPVIAGSGERLYDGIDTTDFDLIDVKRLTNGVLGLTYVPTAR
ncbi:hypothetical protein SANTM175S_05850 [Streptomyces antimycoticus]